MISLVLLILLKVEVHRLSLILKSSSLIIRESELAFGTLDKVVPKQL